MSEETLAADKQDSVKVSKGMNGKFSFKAKLYYNSDKTKYQDVVKQLKDITDDLKKQFGDGKNVE